LGKEIDKTRDGCILSLLWNEDAVSAFSKVVSFDEAGVVGLIRWDNPPVNALNREVRAGLIDAIAEASKRNQIKVLFILPAGNLFSAGADLKEFETGLGEPSLQQVQDAIEGALVPVVAAINGLALGGGLETAMACHYRLAHKSAKLGLPEITLGIIPGAGGTQRLPRLIGPSAALEMILSGAPISADEAKSRGLVDEVAEGDLRDAALNFCERLVQNGVGPRPTRNLSVAAGLSDSDIAEAFRAHARMLKGRTTQTLVVDAIKASALPFAEGIVVEAELARISLASRESHALFHIFFAERESGKVARLPAQREEAEIKRIAIIGAGTMGSAIAIAFADVGRKVTLIDNTETALERSREIIASTYASSVKRGRIVPEIADERTARITARMELAAAADADIVIEAVCEDMELKKEVLSRLDSILPSARLIALNTSTLSVTVLGRATADPSRVAGLHFFAPANVTKLLEIVRGNDTAAETLATALHVAKLLGKVPVVSGDAFGFIGNRMMLDGYFREAEQLLLEGASPMQVDAALERFGFAMGPQRVSDLGGNDVGTKARLELYKRESRPGPYFVIADRLTELGKLGQKTGRGFYRYESGSRGPMPDPDVTALIEMLAAQRGIVPRKIADDEIVERCILALINVGAIVLEEGVASRASDIDVIWTSGYGFPRHLGGPMFYADMLGLGHVAKRIRHYHEDLGHYWRPAGLIERLAAANSSFEQWDRQRTFKSLHACGLSHG
jgi:3-hydroxyacyl-CoA dehydrogenase